MNIKTIKVVVAVGALVGIGGCLSVKTESEVKPIHITMDINLKVDKALDKVYADENQNRSQSNRKAVKDLLDRQVAGLSATSMLEARGKATDDDRIQIAETNARRSKRFSEIAQSSGVSLTTVQKRYAAKMRENIPAGSGVWYQDDAGTWHQK